MVSANVTSLRPRSALAHDRGVGHGGELRVDHERDREDGLEGRLVPARERPAGVGRLELGGGHEPHLAARVLVARPVEAAELVVQGAPERQPQPPGARRERRRERDPAALGRLVGNRDAPEGSPRAFVIVASPIVSSTAFRTISEVGALRKRSG